MREVMIVNSVHKEEWRLLPALHSHTLSDPMGNILNQLKNNTNTVLFSPAAGRMGGSWDTEGSVGVGGEVHGTAVEHKVIRDNFKGIL